MVKILPDLLIENTFGYIQALNFPLDHIQLHTDLPKLLHWRLLVLIFIEYHLLIHLLILYLSLLYLKLDLYDHLLYLTFFSLIENLHFHFSIQRFLVLNMLQVFDCYVPGL